jgi:four helix bundle protein
MRNDDYSAMLERRENIIVKKTEEFGDRIINMYKYLLKKKDSNADILKQILRSGTSVGANVSEGQFAQTKADFLTKMSIALKEANETKYWLKRLYSGDYLNEEEYNSIAEDNEEIINILVKITGTTKENLKK